MKYGLGVNSNETVSEIVKKSQEIERLGLDYVWVADVPSQRYSPAVAAAIAEKTKHVRIGLGLLSPLLHTPRQIANSLITLMELYGPRFEVCIGPGDRDQLKRVGIEFPSIAELSRQILAARTEISKSLGRNKLSAAVWLGAQGPRILKLGRFFDGVMLNYAHPDSVSWALRQMQLPKKYSVKIGVYAPSYIYRREDEEMFQLLRLVSAIVAAGASRRVLEEFQLTRSVLAVVDELEKGLTPEEILNKVPPEVVKVFGICMPVEQVRNYLGQLEILRVDQVVFGYPQNFSLKTICELGIALFENLQALKRG